MEADTVKAEADRKPRTLNSGYKSIALTENEIRRSLRCTTERVPTRFEFETKRPHDFLPLGSKIRFRNVFANYGWRIQAWVPRDCGRTLIVCGFPTKIYNTVPRRRRPAARYTGEGR